MSCYHALSGMIFSCGILPDANESEITSGEVEVPFERVNTLPVRAELFRTNPTGSTTGSFSFLAFACNFLLNSAGNESFFCFVGVIFCLFFFSCLSDQFVHFLFIRVKIAKHRQMK